MDNQASFDECCTATPCTGVILVYATTAVVTTSSYETDIRPCDGLALNLTTCSSCRKCHAVESQTLGFNCVTVSTACEAGITPWVIPAVEA